MVEKMLNVMTNGQVYDSKKRSKNPIVRVNGVNYTMRKDEALKIVNDSKRFILDISLGEVSGTFLITKTKRPNIIRVNNGKISKKLNLRSLVTPVGVDTLSNLELRNHVIGLEENRIFMFVIFNMFNSKYNKTNARHYKKVVSKKKVKNNLMNKFNIAFKVIFTNSSIVLSLEGELLLEFYYETKCREYLVKEYNTINSKTLLEIIDYMDEYIKLLKVKGYSL